MRTFLFVGLLLFGVSANVGADYSPLKRAARSEVAILGHVTSIEKDTVEATTEPTSKEKISYTIASVKVETNIHGAKNTTHLKVGFTPGYSLRKGQFPKLDDGQKVCLFLIKHHGGNFYIFTNLAPPIEINDKTQATVERLKRAAVTFDDPVKALRTVKAEDRLEAASLLIMKYRMPFCMIQNETAAVRLEESQAILAVLMKADWSDSEQEFGAYQAFGNLAIGDIGRIHIKPGDKMSELWKAELNLWHAVDGKDYQIQKFIPKPKK